MPNSSARCPECSKPRDPEFRPFCSRGCRDRDLIKWFGGDYRVPANDPPDGAIDSADGGDE
ncbi:MAG: DNA gyrase inhibitor YacG [Sphingopyxis sp.]|nr:DNA gyrase inhibitor YacG [Sphingopyxis sp.]